MYGLNNSHDGVFGEGYDNGIRTLDRMLGPEKPDIAIAIAVDGTGENRVSQGRI
jgi:hypothetical protein